MAYQEIERCTDKEYLYKYLSEESLSMINDVLKAYAEGILELVIPRDEQGFIDLDGEFRVVIIDPTYKETGHETLVLKWYESFEDTGYLLECFGIRTNEPVSFNPQKNYKTFRYILSHKTRATRCNRCNSPVILSDNPEYKFQCLSCDEDLYEIETHEGEPTTDDEFKRLCLLAVDEFGFDADNRENHFKRKETRNV